MNDLGPNEQRARELSDGYFSAERRAVLLAIGAHLDAGDFPTFSRLADECQLSLADFRTIVKALEDDGDLEVSGEAFHIPQAWEMG